MNWKPLTVMVLVLAGGGLSPVLADKEGAPPATLDGLRADYDAAYQAWIGKIRAAADREARNKLMQDRPSPAGTVERMVPLITAQADDPAVLKQVAWVVQMMRSDTPDAVVEVLEKHKNSADVAEVVLVASTRLEGRIAEVLEWIRENNREGRVQAVTAFIAAQQRGLPDDEKLELLKEVFANAGDLEVRGRKLVDAAKRGIFEIENLAIGKVAPEIEGTDQDGVAFKLSDYRGKVVVLDFWGDW